MAGGNVHVSTHGKRVTLGLKSGRGPFCADEGDKGMVCNRDVAQEWEQLTLLEDGFDKPRSAVHGASYMKDVRLLGGNTRKFCKAEGSHGEIKCNYDGMSKSTTPGVVFQLYQKGESFALRSKDTNKFCRDEGSKIVCSSDVVGPFDKFKPEGGVACDFENNFVLGKAYDQVHVGDNISKKAAMKACMHHDDRRGRDCFVQQHTNGHTACGFFHQSLEKEDAFVPHKHNYGAVCSSRAWMDGSE